MSKENFFQQRKGGAASNREFEVDSPGGNVGDWEGGCPRMDRSAEGGYYQKIRGGELGLGWEGGGAIGERSEKDATGSRDGRGLHIGWVSNSVTDKSSPRR